MTMTTLILADALATMSSCSTMSGGIGINPAEDLMGDGDTVVHSEYQKRRSINLIMDRGAEDMSRSQSIICMTVILLTNHLLPFPTRTEIRSAIKSGTYNFLDLSC